MNDKLPKQRPWQLRVAIRVAWALMPAYGAVIGGSLRAGGEGRKRKYAVEPFRNAGDCDTGARRAMLEQIR